MNHPPSGEVVWLVHGAEAPPRDPRLLRASSVASQRLRVALPAAFLAEQGVAQRTEALRGDDDVARITSGRPAALILSKLLAGPGSNEHVARHERLAARLKAEKIPFCIDVCDNYFETAAAQPMRRMLALADAVIANSEATADLLHEQAGARPIVIADPAEGVRTEPLPAPRSGLARLFGKRRPARAAELLWFGAPLLKPLAALLPELARYSGKQALSLHLVTAPFPEVTDFMRRAAAAGPRLAVRFTPWSLDAIPTALAAADIVLLPGDPTDPARTGASANRVIQALWAGRYAVANGVPSYWQFKDCAHIGDDLLAGIDWALGHPAAARARILRGQDIVERYFSTSTIGAAWLRLIGDLLPDAILPALSAAQPTGKTELRR
jgi:hypothetical protein